MNMNIKIEPSRIYQGSHIRLQVDPHFDQANQYYFEWEYVNFSEDHAAPGENDAEKVIDTTRLSPGAYRVRVTAQSADQVGRAERRTASKVFTVEPRPVTGDQLDRIIEKADRFMGKWEEELDHERAAPRVQPVLARTSPIDVNINLKRRFPDETQSDLNVSLWQSIRNRTDAISFEPYKIFVDEAFCAEDNAGIKRRTLNYNGVDAYKMLRSLTEAFLILNAGVFIQIPPGSTREELEASEKSRMGRDIALEEISDRLSDYLEPQGGLPYLRRIVRALNDQRVVTDEGPDCLFVGENQLIFDDGMRQPLLLELIWSYWHEESMLVQAINAVSLRFQNRLNGGNRDPLSNLAIDPLRPLGNLLWGYVQEEYKRLTVNRRAHEYASHYGLKLVGKAVSDLQPVDTRTKFIEAFHNLLYMTTVFYKQVDDTTVNADPFPVLNALREVHMILAQGAHNQFGDMPWASRAEMLTQQWIMSRHEMSDFLRGRIMVPYEEPWMGAVDTMKTLQGWTDTSVSQFHRLARFGEQLLLSIRYTDWVDINDPEPARNWALYWRAEIQNYIHSYRATTGVELTAEAAMTQPAEVRYRMPSELLLERLSSNGKNGSRRSLPRGQENPQQVPAAQPRATQPAAAPQLSKPQNENGNGSSHAGFRERKLQRK